MARLILAAALVLSACGSPEEPPAPTPAPPAPAPEPAAPAIDTAAIEAEVRGTPALAPDATTVTIGIDAQGATSIDGQPIARPELDARIAALVARVGADHVRAVLSADPAAPSSDTMAITDSLTRAGVVHIAIAPLEIH